MEWYYAVGDDRRGPVNEDEFRVLVSNGSVRPDTLVWRTGMPDWVPFRALSGGVSNYSGEVGMRYAGFWIRFVAKFIDIVILNIIGFIIGFAAGFVAGMALPEETEALLQIFVIVISFAINALYYVVFVATSGATPGKMMLGLRVVRADGSSVSFGLAFARYVAAALNYFTLLIGWFMAGWNDEKRGLHDYICDTRVIHAD